MNPKFRVFMGNESNWHEIHGSGQNNVLEYTKENTIIKPHLDLEVNNAGKFEFTMPTCHTKYSMPEVDRTMVEVYELAPAITTRTTVHYNANNETYKQPVAVCSIDSPSYSDYVTIEISYAEELVSIAALEQMFKVTQTCDGHVHSMRQIACQSNNTNKYEYAFIFVTGKRNTFTIESCGETPATVPPTIKISSSHVDRSPVYKSIFYGRVSQIDIDFYNSKIIKCEGALAFLNDVVIRNEKNTTGGSGQEEGSTTSLETFIETFLDYYNKGGAANATDSKAVADRLKMNTEVEFQNGVVTDSKFVYRNISYENAFDVFSKKIIGAEGGYFLMNRSNLNSDGTHPANSSGTGWKYILPKVDDPYPPNNNFNFQVRAEYAMNITDLKKTNTIDDIVTTVIPIGKYNSDDITIKKAEYINKTIKLYDNRNGSAISNPVRCNYISSETLVPYTYFALYDPVGGCRIWVKSTTGGVTLGWYVTEQQGVRRADKTRWDNDRNNSEQAPTAQLTRSISANTDTSFSIGTGSQYSGINYRTVYGWNYFVIMATDSSSSGEKNLSFTRIDRDADDKTGGSANKYMLDYIQDPDLAELYGNKSKVVEFNDITGSSKAVVKRNLMKAGVDWLNRQIYMPKTLEVNAVDMTYLARNGEDGHYPFMLGEGVRVRSMPHDISTTMTITKLSIDMDSAKSILTLGTPQIPTLTEYYRSKKKGEYTKEYVINDNDN